MTFADGTEAEVAAFGCGAHPARQRRRSAPRLTHGADAITTGFIVLGMTRCSRPYSSGRHCPRTRGGASPRVTVVPGARAADQVPIVVVPARRLPGGRRIAEGSPAGLCGDPLPGDQSDEDRRHDGEMVDNTVHEVERVDHESDHDVEDGDEERLPNEFAFLFGSPIADWSCWTPCARSGIGSSSD